MEDGRKFIIGKRILKRSDFFKEETHKKKTTTISFEKDKIF